MQIWAVTMVKNEIEVIELTLRNMIAQGIDRMIVADNMSTDGTRELLEALSSTLPVEVVEDGEPRYWQAEKMTNLANQAAAGGADWIIPFDADEIWRARNGGTVRQVMEAAESSVLAAAVFDHHPRPTFRRGNLLERQPWRLNSGFAKVAFRWQPGITITDGNHEVWGIDAQPVHGHLVIEHYPYRSWKQFKRKIRGQTAALDGIPESRFIGARIRRLGKMSSGRLRLSWWWIRLDPRARRPRPSGPLWRAD